MLTFTARNHPITNHWEELSKKIADILQPQIRGAVNASVGTIRGDVVKIEGDILEGIHIEADMNRATHIDDLFAQEHIEQAVLSTMDFMYGPTVERAANEISGAHPEDTLSTTMP